jgi:MFS family permease
VDDLPSSGRTRLPLFALLAANAVSLLGNVVAAVAIPWLVLEETGSAALTGLAASLAALPLAAGALFGGAVIDRIGARRASVIADLTSAAAVAAIPILDGAGRLSFGAIAAAAFFGALFDAPGQAARQALVPELAERAGVPLERANSLLVGTEHVGYVLGAPAAGALVALVGAAEALWVDAASFAACAVLVVLAVPRLRPAVEPGRRYLRDLVEGLSFIRRDAVLLALLANMTLGNLLISPLAPVILPVYAREELGGPGELGLTIAAYGAGGIAGTALFAVVALRLPRNGLYAATKVAYAALWPALILLPELALLLLVLFAIGLVAGAINPLLATVRQERAPPDLRGRVLATSAAGVAVAVPVGTLLGGLAIEWLGLRGALALFAGGNVLLSLAVVAVLARSKVSLEPAAAER